MLNTYKDSLPDGYSFVKSSSVLPEEIIALRESVHWLGDTNERWSLIIKQSLEIIVVRSDSNDLVGMACLAGNLRHAVLCDLVVHPAHQNLGIGEAIMSKLEQSIKRLDIKYTYAELAETNPFRKKMIESGFKSTGNSLFRER